MNAGQLDVKTLFEGLACPANVKTRCGIFHTNPAPCPEPITTSLERMKRHRIRKLIEQAANNAGIPETLYRDIVPLAKQTLETSSHGLNPQYRDAIWAVDRARREWGHRFLSALDARCAKSDATLSSAA